MSDLGEVPYCQSLGCLAAGHIKSEEYMANLCSEHALNGPVPHVPEDSDKGMEHWVEREVLSHTLQDVDVNHWLAADVILESQWLKNHDRTVRARVLTEVADKWQWGDWTVVTRQIREAGGGAADVMAVAQTVTNWLRSRVMSQ